MNDAIYTRPCPQLLIGIFNVLTCGYCAPSGGGIGATAGTTDPIAGGTSRAPRRRGFGCRRRDPASEVAEEQVIAEAGRQPLMGQVGPGAMGISGMAGMNGMVGANGMPGGMPLGAGAGAIPFGAGGMGGAPFASGMGMGTGMGMMPGIDPMAGAGPMDAGQLQMGGAPMGVVPVGGGPVGVPPVGGAGVGMMPPQTMSMAAGGRPVVAGY